VEEVIRTEVNQKPLVVVECSAFRTLRLNVARERIHPLRRLLSLMSTTNYTHTHRTVEDPNMTENYDEKCTASGVKTKNPLLHLLFGGFFGTIVLTKKVVNI